MPEIFTVFSEFKQFRFYFGIFFSLVLIFVLFWFWFPCFVVTHLSTSSSWQTEVQDKTLPAWSWHILCTVESLDLAMFDDRLSLAPVGRVGQPSGQREWKAPAQYCPLRLGWERAAPSSALPSPPVPSHSWLGSAPALLAGSPLVICAGAPPPESLSHNCQLEWLPPVIQISQMNVGFPLHLVISVLTP